MPFLLGWFLCYLLFSILMHFGLHPKYAVFWVFQIVGTIFIAVLIKILLVGKMKSRN